MDLIHFSIFSVHLFPYPPIDDRPNHPYAVQMACNGVEFGLSCLMLFYRAVLGHNDRWVSEWSGCCWLTVAVAHGSIPLMLCAAADLDYVNGLIEIFIDFCWFSSFTPQPQQSIYHFWDNGGMGFCFTIVEFQFEFLFIAAICMLRETGIEENN